MSPHIHIEDARAAIDAVNDELTTWINRARNAEQRETDLLQSWAEADVARQSAECAHADLAEEFSDVAANAQWLADIIQSHLSHLPEAREALDASPGVSTARLKAEIRAEVENEINGPVQMGEPVLPKPPTLPEQALRLCYRIERAGASPELTEASVLANELLKVLRGQASGGQ